MNIAQKPTDERSAFKIVCDNCGSLSIKRTDLPAAASDAPIECGRCGAIRGTLADLQTLASQGTDQFEF
jgi:transcription elongation factor Elf1